MRNYYPLQLVLPFVAFPVAVFGASDHTADMAESLRIFTDEVRPIFLENCVKCHGGEKTRSAFDMVTRDGLLAGGEQGEAVIIGKPETSPLVQYMRHAEEPFMPPKKPQLPEASIAAVEKWIALGAAYDKPLVVKADDEEAGPMVVTKGDREFWSFAPLKQEFGSKNKVDDFLEAGEASSMRVLARRLTFDLTGLPPEPNEMDALEKSASPGAYAEFVEKLLASPRYGERWARHWLDVARYAESHGFEHDYDRKFAFHFRDFVIRALNMDMPYDQFVKWQLAGDEIAPDKPLAMMATGFLGAGVYPTQITISEAERVRYDAMDDMLSTVGSAMLATTIGCARCHDHKYDPIPTRDYYQMLSAFSTTVRSDVKLDLSLLDERNAGEFSRELGAIKTKLAKYESEQLPLALDRWVKLREKSGTAPVKPSWFVLKAESLKSKGGVVFEDQPDGSYLATGPNPHKDTYTFTAKNSIAGATAIRLEALAHESMNQGGPGRAGNGNIQLTGIEVKAGGKKIALKNPRATFQQNPDSLSIDSSIDGNAGTGWALDPQFGKDHAAIFEIGNPTDIAAGAELTITLRFDGNTSHTIGRPRLSVSDCPATTLDFGGGQDPRVTAEQAILALNLQKDRATVLEHFKVLDPEYQKIAGEVAALDATRAKLEQMVMVCSDGNKVKPMRHHTSSGEIPDFYKETHILNRGDTKQKVEVAKLGFLQVLSRGEAPQSGGRMALAEWITDEEKGAGHLLARVIVNRLWQHHFGEGIVATPNDFGFQGDRPTNPELLDWLAVQLIKNGWSLKHIHRLILNSDAYRAKRAPRRLEAEAIRDAALAVGGLLDGTMYGEGTLNEGMRRRSIYFQVKRSQVVPVMQLFDWPDTLTSLGRRAVTTTPSQALVFINNPNMRQIAEGFAKRIASEEDQIGAAYLIAYGRLPTDEERVVVDAFMHRQEESHGGDQRKALSDFCAALMSANEFIYIE
jgi:mono/diheme cytochrome c family protein